MSSGLYSGVSGLALGTGLYRDVSGLWSGASGLIAGFDGGNPYSGASLYLDFLTMTAPSFDTRITFSRGSDATLTDSTGKITYAPANLLTYSQDTSNAAWIAINGSKASSSVVGPDGLNNLGLFTATSAGNRLQNIPSLLANTTYVLSAYMSPGTASYGGLVAAGVASAGAIFNLSGNGSVVSTVGSGVSAAITKVGSLYRVALTFTTSSAGFSNLGAGVSDGSTYSSVYPSATSGNINVGFFQLEPVTYQTTPSTYQATTSTAYYGPRFDYDPVTLAAKGLLIEEQRTNLLTYSQEFDNAAWGQSAVTVTANATAAPDGTNTADKVVENTANSLHTVIRNITTVAAPYTWSCHIKAAERTFAFLYHVESNAGVSINLLTGATGTPSGTVAPTASTVTSVGNGWYRLTMTATATAALNSFRVYVATSLTSTVYTGDGTSGIYVWGAQLEAGSFATSYIPTVASTVTRSADLATMTGANFSAWFNAAEGTFVTIGTLLAVAASSTQTAVTALTDNNNYIGSAFNNGVGTRFATEATGGVNQGFLSASGAAVAGTIQKLAHAYKANDCALSVDGLAAITDNTVTLPSCNALQIGHKQSGNQLNGHVRSVAYYNTRLPNAQLQTLTAPSATATLSLDFTSGSYTVGY